MRYVQVVSKQKLQGVPAGRKGYFRFGLPASEVPHALAEGKRFLHVGQLVEVDQQVVMSGVGYLHSGGSHSHVRKTEFHGESPVHGLAVFRADDVSLGARRRLGKMLVRESLALPHDERNENNCQYPVHIKASHAIKYTLFRKSSLSVETRSRMPLWCRIKKTAAIMYIFQMRSLTGAYQERGEKQK